MQSNCGVRAVRPRKRRGWWVVLVLLTGALLVGYQMQYKPRAETKNYASCAAIVLSGVEIKLAAFEAADEARRLAILQSLPALWDKFCEIDCPENARADEIQWKMAKVFEYARGYMRRALQLRPEDHVRGEWVATAADVQARIGDLRVWINDTIEYGNFKRWR